MKTRDLHDTHDGRRPMLAAVEQALGPVAPRFAEALLAVPRERFVRTVDVGRASEDIPLPLDDGGLSTISAPHAYILSFALADLAVGDALLELGSGTGYGAALAAHIVGPAGRVVTIEIDPKLAAWAKALLAPVPNVTVLEGDAVTTLEAWHGMNKIICTFAVARVPDAWLDRLPEGGVLVMPVGEADRIQTLVRIERARGSRELVTTEHGGVRYVHNRSRG